MGFRITSVVRRERGRPTGRGSTAHRRIAALLDESKLQIISVSLLSAHRMVGRCRRAIGVKLPASTLSVSTQQVVSCLRMYSFLPLLMICCPTFVARQWVISHNPFSQMCHKLHTS